jgi:hypothetical protein
MALIPKIDKKPCTYWQMACRVRAHLRASKPARDQIGQPLSRRSEVVGAGVAGTISSLPTITTTSAMIPPSFTDLIFPLNWLRALSMAVSK